MSPFSADSKAGEANGNPSSSSAAKRTGETGRAESRPQLMIRNVSSPVVSELGRTHRILGSGIDEGTRAKPVCAPSTNISETLEVIIPVVATLLGGGLLRRDRVTAGIGLLGGGAISALVFAVMGNARPLIGLIAIVAMVGGTIADERGKRLGWARRICRRLLRAPYRIFLHIVRPTSGGGTPPVHGPETGTDGPSMAEGAATVLALVSSSARLRHVRQEKKCR
jgi:hypothetical protein